MCLTFSWTLKFDLFLNADCPCFVLNLSAVILVLKAFVLTYIWGVFGVTVHSMTSETWQVDIAIVIFHLLVSTSILNGSVLTKQPLILVDCRVALKSCIIQFAIRCFCVCVCVCVRNILFVVVVVVFGWENSSVVNYTWCFCKTDQIRALKPSVNTLKEADYHYGRSYLVISSGECFKHKCQRQN